MANQGGDTEQGHIGGSPPLVQRKGSVRRGSVFAQYHQLPVVALEHTTLRNGLSRLGWSADRSNQVYLRFEGVNLDLSDIELLREYKHLQEVDLSHNNIQDLGPLSPMRHLLHLNVAHNAIEHFLDFEPAPLQLLTANFSYNQISSLSALHRHRFLTKLLLDYNNISEITGLEQCTQLKHLSLRRNKIRNIERIDTLPLQHLDLSGNLITRIENIQHNRGLASLDLSSNSIRSLEGIEDHPMLTTINLEGNQIMDVKELRWLVNLPLLSSLDLLRNPIQNMPHYREVVIFNIISLVSLDGTPVTAEQKVKATNIHHPPKEVADMLMHNASVSKLLAEMASMRPHTPVCTDGVEAPPILVLVGPRGTHKHAIVDMLVKRHPDKIRMSVSHTTRPPRNNEVDGKHYHFVSHEYMKNKINMGNFFMESMELFGHTYGESVEAVQAILDERKVCVLCMELEGAKSLLGSHLQAYFVLLKMVTTEDLEQSLRSEADHESEREILNWVAHAQEYSVWEDSGMFDAVIGLRHDVDLSPHKADMKMLGGGLGPATEASILECVEVLEGVLKAHLWEDQSGELSASAQKVFPTDCTNSTSDVTDAENLTRETSSDTVERDTYLEIEYSPLPQRCISAKLVLPPIAV